MMETKVKKFLREEALAQRKSLSLEDQKKQSAEIIQQLIAQLDWSKYQKVHVFLGMKEQNEIDTMPLFYYLWKNYPSVCTFTNRIEKKEIFCCEIKKDTPLEVHAFGMLEPCSEAACVSPSEIDLFVMPLLLCDYRGSRVGYGGGFYDRLLANANPSALRAGVNFFSPLLEKIPAENHDESLHFLFTPQRCFDFYSSEQLSKVKLP